MVSTLALLQEGSGAFLCFHLLPVPGWVFPGILASFKSPKMFGQLVTLNCRCE